MDTIFLNITHVDFIHVGQWVKVKRRRRRRAAEAVMGRMTARKQGEQLFTQERRSSGRHEGTMRESQTDLRTDTDTHRHPRVLTMR